MSTKLDVTTLTKADLEVIGVIDVLEEDATAAAIAGVLYFGDFTFGPERRHVTKVAMRCRSLERRGFLWHRWSDDDSRVRIYALNAPRRILAEAMLGWLVLALYPEMDKRTAREWAEAGARALERKA